MNTPSGTNSKTALSVEAKPSPIQLPKTEGDNGENKAVKTVKKAGQKASQTAVPPKRTMACSVTTTKLTERKPALTSSNRLSNTNRPLTSWATATPRSQLQGSQTLINDANTTLKRKTSNISTVSKLSIGTTKSLSTNVGLTAGNSETSAIKPTDKFARPGRSMSTVSGKTATRDSLSKSILKPIAGPMKDNVGLKKPGTVVVTTRMSRPITVQTNQRLKTIQSSEDISSDNVKPGLAPPKAINTKLLDRSRFKTNRTSSFLEKKSQLDKTSKDNDLALPQNLEKLEKMSVDPSEEDQGGILNKEKQLNI